jgi:hypothetical protein
MLGALGHGFAAVWRNRGLAVLVLLVSLGFAALLAAPLAVSLDRDLEHTGASVVMMYGFDHGWWKEWSERQTGPSGSLGPDLLGAGFAAKNLDLLLRGHLPLGLFPGPRDGADPGGELAPGVDPVILGLGALYLLVQTLLTGGLLGVFREPSGGWTFRGLVHGSGFYAGRLLRVMLLAMLGAWIVFALHAPVARWANARAREALSETAALAWSLGHYALLLLALVVLHMVSSFAKVIVVVEERSSAVLVLLSSLGFCGRHFGRALGQYVVVTALGALLLLAWGALDRRFEVTGYKTQLVFLALAQALVLARVGLRLGLLAGQVALYRRPDRAA